MAGGKPRHNRSGRQPPTSSRGAVVVSDWRGLLRVQKWPRKRGKPKHPAVIWWNEWFRQANALAKYAPAAFQSTARQATQQSALMPRDIMIMAMRGRLFTFQIEGLGTVYSVAGRQDTSTALDLLGKAPGSLLYRGSDLWLPLTIGLPGQVLTAGANSTPEWANAGGGGSTPYSPPTTSTLPLEINADGIATVDSAYESLVLKRRFNSTAPRWGGRFRLNELDHQTAIAGFSAFNNGSQELSYGLTAYNSATGRFAMCGVLWTNSNQTPSFVLMTTDEGGTILHTWENHPIRVPSPVFFTLRYDGPNYWGGYGLQPDATDENSRMDSSDIGGAPTHWGIWIGWGNTAGDRTGQQLSCIHWEQQPDI